MSRTPITFQHPDVFDHLRTHQFVYTFRADRTTGRVWLRRERGGTKIADGTLRSIHSVDDEQHIRDDLSASSGFDSRDDWISAIRSLHGIESISGTVYLCRVTEWTDGGPIHRSLSEGST